MVVIHDIEVTVQVDGQNLQEYDDDEDEVATPNEIAKYIQAISNAKFAISIKLLDGFKFASDALVFKVYVDGVLVIEPILKKGDRNRTWLVRGRKEKDGHRTYIRPFYFADLPSREYIYRVPVFPVQLILTVHQTEKTEAEVEQFAKAQMQGTISVKAFKVKLFGSADEREYRRCALDEDQNISKKARVKTGATHRSK